jgi:actin-related protein
MQIVPIIDGYEIESARSKLVPGNITEHLARLLTERGHYFTTQSQLNIVRKIKERACYVALDYNKVTLTTSDKFAI